MKKDTNTNDNIAEVITEVYHCGVERGKRKTIITLIRGALSAACLSVLVWCAKKAFIADCKSVLNQK